MSDMGPDTRSEADYARAASSRYEIERRFEIERTARELTEEWNAALAEYRRTDSTRAYETEQKAYDALVDFVEENGLNYSEFDPRGPEEAQKPDDDDPCPRCGGDHDRIDRREPCPPSETRKPCGCYADDPGCPAEHLAYNEKQDRLYGRAL